MCELCKEKEETTTHLFFERKIAKELCNKGDSWVGVSLVNHNQPLTNF